MIQTAKTTFTTADQLDYLRGLERRGKYRVIRAELNLLDQRIWTGDGMSVDKRRLRQEMKAMLERESAIDAARAAHETNHPAVRSACEDA